MVKLVVGLGNPGQEYEFTRHNIGWLALDQLSFESQLRWTEKFKGFYADHAAGVHNDKIYFLKPQTFMNLSGESVIKVMQFFKIEPTQILVVHDELDLPFGQVMFKKGGGTAGHNGLKSIAQCLGTQDFLRLRLGISRPVHGSVSSWVLSSFSKDEEIALADYLKSAAGAVEFCLRNGVEKASQEFNKKNFVITKKG